MILQGGSPQGAAAALEHIVGTKYSFTEMKDINLLELNKAFAKIFSFMSQHEEDTKEIKQLLKSRPPNEVDTFEKEFTKRGFYETKETLGKLSAEVERVVDRMVTKSDLVAQEMRINRLASSEDIDKMADVIENSVRKDEFLDLAGAVDSAPSRVEMDSFTNKLERRIEDLEDEIRAQLDNRVLKSVHEVQLSIVKDNITDMQSYSNSAVGALQEWKETVDSEVETIQLELENNVIKRDEWSEFMEHAEGFATGDMWEEMMHDVRKGQLQIDKLVRDEKSLFEGQSQHMKLLDEKANLIDLDEFRKLVSVTYATQDNLNVCSKKMLKLNRQKENELSNIMGKLSEKASSTSLHDISDKVFELDEKQNVLIVDMLDRATKVEVKNNRTYAENLQQQITFMRNQLEGLKALSKKASDMMDEAAFAQSLNVPAPPPMSILLPTSAATGSPPSSVQQLEMQIHSAELAKQQLMDTKEKLNNHIEEIKERQKEVSATSGNTDVLRAATSSNRLKIYTDKVRSLDDRIVAQDKMISDLKQSIETISADVLGNLSKQVDEPGPVSRKSKNEKSIERKPSPLPAPETIVKVEAKPSVDESFETLLPAAGVRCLFCERPVPRISKSTRNSPTNVPENPHRERGRHYSAGTARRPKPNVRATHTGHVYGKGSRNNKIISRPGTAVRRKIESGSRSRPQSARVRLGRLTDGAFRPPSPPRSAFRIAGLVPTRENSKPIEPSEERPPSQVK